jgi:predicted pyridoxine 5'-phosphate oxidase superfamily flavin-nucleotide-binding protein
MPEQHRAFFPLLRFVCLAVPDAEGWPLATLVTGAPGFASSPAPDRLQVAAMPAPDDPVRAHLKAGTPAGLLGIDLGTRRRNRLNGIVAQAASDGFAVDVLQSFGNCPRYIQVRQLLPVVRRPGPAVNFDAALPARARELLASSSTLFVASASGKEVQGAAAGLDISHRGGPPGFARLQGSVLTVPDYNGNRYFNTLGNFIAEPRAAIVLADFASGDLLQLQGIVDIDWTAADPDQTPPVERVWRFRIVRGVLREDAFGLASEMA